VFTVIKLVPILSTDSLIYVIEADPKTVKFCNTVKLPDTVVVLPEISTQIAAQSLIAVLAFIAMLLNSHPVDEIGIKYVVVFGVFIGVIDFILYY
jgi:hypothetical protein